MAKTADSAAASNAPASGGASAAFEASIASIEAMGYHRARAIQALARAHGDVDLAITFLLEE